MKQLILFLFVPGLLFSQTFNSVLEEYKHDDKLKKAEKHLDKVYTDTTSLDYMYLKGTILRKKGNYSKAKWYIQKVLELDQSYAYAHDELGVLEVMTLNNKDYTLALSHFNKALTFKPKDPTILAHRGATYFMINEYSLALEDYSKALTKDKKGEKQDKLYYNIGLCHLWLDEQTKAIEMFTMALTLNPFDPKAHYDRGIAYYELERYKEAKDDFQYAMLYKKTENDWERLDKDDIRDWIKSCKYLLKEKK